MLKTNMVTKGGKWREVIPQELGVNTHTLLYIRLNDQKGPTV